jgi:hypothetical protein
MVILPWSLDAGGIGRMPFAASHAAPSMARPADRLDVVMMRGGVAEVVVVFVCLLPAVRARQRIRTRPSSETDLDVNSLARLDLVAVARRVRRWTWAPGLRIVSEGH